MWGLGFRVEGLGFRVRGLGFRVQGHIVQNLFVLAQDALDGLERLHEALPDLALNALLSAVEHFITRVAPCFEAQGRGLEF